MQSLPLELWQRIFCSFQSDAVSDRSCVNLALTCKTCREAFATSRQESCKKAAVKRLLRWTAFSSNYWSDRVRVRVTVSCRKTKRLFQWLKNGFLTVPEFWEAQDASKPVIKGLDGDAERELIMVLVLDKKTRKALSC